MNMPPSNHKPPARRIHYMDTLKNDSPEIPPNPASNPRQQLKTSAYGVEVSIPDPGDQFRDGAEGRGLDYRVQTAGPERYGSATSLFAPLRSRLIARAPSHVVLRRPPR